jgi:choline kinase
MLSKLGLIEYLDLILSNEDVKNSKPHPEIYWSAMKTLDVLPEETIIVEDSPVGLLSAQRSSANVVRVNSPKDVNFEIIEDIIHQKTEKNLKWVDKKLNVLVPMAGEGSRFKEKGYNVPKPLININGKLMIQHVVESLNLDANFIYVVQKSHNLQYNLNTMLNLITPNCKIVEVDGLTEGAVCSTLIAKELFDNKNPLMIVNSDQFIEWNSSNFYYKMNEANIDGGVVTFDSSETKWSYVKISDGYIIETAEKNPISNDATVGIYYWKKGSDYVKSAENMISKNIRVNNEFYICPVYNEAINDGKLFAPYKVNKMWGLGTPEDLKFYLENFNN